MGGDAKAGWAAPKVVRGVDAGRAGTSAKLRELVCPPAVVVNVGC